MDYNIDFIYITNIPYIGKFITNHNVRWVMVDLEYRGKAKRQEDRDTVISAHKISDVKNMRAQLNSDSLLVRINPINRLSIREIDAVIDAGADAIMLPYFQTKQEIEYFVELIASRCKVFLLLETMKGIQNIADILSVKGIDYVHIGLNDLHIERNTKFMFEFIADGSIDPIASILTDRGMKFGIGGVGRYGKLLPPAESVLSEHIRLGSHGAILSRSFMNATIPTSSDEFCSQFQSELEKLRSHINEAACKDPFYFAQNQKQFNLNVSEVVDKLSGI
tara:strand:- start:3311 stop:4144 length:834 start_codon:yes stop_codon:yes gene_type:complete